MQQSQASKTPVQRYLEKKKTEQAFFNLLDRLIDERQIPRLPAYPAKPSKSNGHRITGK